MKLQSVSHGVLFSGFKDDLQRAKNVLSQNQQLDSFTKSGGTVIIEKVEITESGAKESKFKKVGEGVATGAVIGTQAAATALTIWPGAGNAANATITYGLHQMTGRACIAFCEDCGNLSITSDADAIAHFGVRMKNFVNVIKNDKIRELATAAIDKALDIVF